MRQRPQEVAGVMRRTKREDNQFIVLRSVQDRFEN